jgi:DNA-binding NarL/FixJ family response regulator
VVCARPWRECHGPVREENTRETHVADIVTLVLADHRVLFAEGLGMLLDAEDDLAVLGLVHHSSQAVEAVAHHRPAVFVVEAHLPDRGLGQTLAAARAASPTTKLLVLVDDASPETTAAVLTSGADGCLAKDQSSRQVAAAIRRLAAGEQAVVGSAARAPGRDASVELLVGTLTSRECEILGLLTHGLTTRRIAQQLCLSYQTVRSHIYSVFVKLEVHSQLEAVRSALEHQVVQAPAPLPRSAAVLSTCVGIRRSRIQEKWSRVASLTGGLGPWGSG